MAVSNINNRPDGPVGTEQVIINGQPITLRRNPDLTVRLVPVEVVPTEPPPPPPENNEEPAAEPATPEAIDTVTPVPAEAEEQPTNTPEAAVPTAVPVPSVIKVAYTVQQGDTLYKITTQKSNLYRFNG